MTSEDRPLRLIIGSTLLAILILIVLLVGNIPLGDRIQAASMITLVFITLFYAVQTQALVKEERRALEEGKKKRSADFGERKMIVLLGPLSDKLKVFTYNFRLFFEETDKMRFHELSVEARKELRTIEEFYRANMHMASDKLRGELQTFLNETQITLWRSAAWIDEEKISTLQGMQSGLHSLIRTIELEIEKITAHLQSTYGDTIPA
jgi:hypothetical protein